MIDLVAPRERCRIRVVHVESPGIDELMAEITALAFRQESDEHGPLDREIFYCGDAGRLFEFGGLSLVPEAWPECLLRARRLVAEACDLPEALFSACLVNRYREGKGSIPFHSDDVTRHDPPLVASLSLGGPRLFRLRPKLDAPEPLLPEHMLEPGSIVILDGPEAHSHYEHQLPLTGGKNPLRISCTFRPIVKTTTT